MIAGFVVQPGSSKQVLIRAVGPRLNTLFEIVGHLRRTRRSPSITASNVLIASNDNWLTADGSAMTSVGALRSPTQRDSADGRHAGARHYTPRSAA